MSSIIFINYAVKKPGFMSIQKQLSRDVLEERSSQKYRKIKKRVSFLINLQARGLQPYQKRLWQRCFPVNFAKVLRIAFYRTPLVAASTAFTHNKFVEVRSNVTLIINFQLFDFILVYSGIFKTIILQINTTLLISWLNIYIFTREALRPSFISEQ